MADCTYVGPDWDDLPVIPDGVNTAEVTEGCVDGAGIYDVFMRSHMDAIQQEYKKQRIKGVEYSQVYLGGMQAAMTQAVAFALQKDEAAAKAELAKYAILNAQSAYLKSQAEVLLVGEQICKLQKETELVSAQIRLTTAQTWAEIAKTTVEIPTYMGEMLQEPAVLTGPAPVDNALDIASLMGAQISKTHRERNLLASKELTEQAQTLASVKAKDDDGGDTAPGTPIVVAGVVGKEKNLLQRQSDGFLRDAEAKVAKIAADSFAVQYSTVDGDVTTSGWSLDDLWAMVQTADSNTSDADHADGPIDNSP
jgi:hypothetical protein